MRAGTCPFRGHANAARMDAAFGANARDKPTGLSTAAVDIGPRALLNLDERITRMSADVGGQAL